MCHGWKNTKWQKISGWKIFPFSQKSHFSLMCFKPLFVIYVTTASWPHWPLHILSSLFHLALSNALIRLLHFTQTPGPRAPFVLSSSVPCPPSILGHLFTTIPLTNVSLLEKCYWRMFLLRRWQAIGDRDVWLVLLPVCSQGKGNTPQRVLTLQGCAASDGMTRGGCVGWKGPGGNVEQQQWEWPWVF